MTAEEKQAEAIWTYTISRERIFRRLADKGIVSQENACDKLLKRVHSTSLALTPTLWITSTNAIGIKTHYAVKAVGQKLTLRSYDVQGMAIPGAFDGTGEVL